MYWVFPSALGVGPQEHLDIIDKRSQNGVKQGLKWLFSGSKTHF